MVTVDGPDVEGRYNDKYVKFTVVDKSIIREKSRFGSVSNILDEKLDGMGQMRNQYRIKTRDEQNYGNTSLLMYDKDVFNQIKAVMHGNH